MKIDLDGNPVNDLPDLIDLRGKGEIYLDSKNKEVVIQTEDYGMSVHDFQTLEDLSKGLKLAVELGWLKKPEVVGGNESE